MKKLFDFYISSSLHVAVEVISLSLITLHHFTVPFNFQLEAFIFFGTITGYNFVKYAGIAKLHHISLTKNLKLIQIFSFIAFVFLIYYCFQQKLSVILLSAILGFFTIFYVLPIFSIKNLRGVPSAKIFIISFVCTGVTILLPLVDHVKLLQGDIIISFIQRFCVLVAIILPFDIRDLRFDKANLGTIPQILGVRKTKILGVSLFCFAVVIEFLKDKLQIESILSLITAAIIGIFLLEYSKLKQPKYYSSFWVEAVPIFWLISLYLWDWIIR